jgi:hypothetical protein
MYFPDSKMLGHALKFAVSGFGTFQAIGRVIRQNEFYHGPACMNGPHRVGLYHHSFGCIGTTGRSEVSPAYYFYHTNPAATGLVFNVEVMQFHVTEGGDFYSHLRSSLEKRCALLH